ncbi:MAG: hypothetical protein ACOYD3_10140, partial [Kiritimatiellia bacterium]
MGFTVFDYVKHNPDLAEVLDVFMEEARGSCKTLPNAGRQACIREGFAGIFDDAAGCRRTSGRNRAFP